MVRECNLEAHRRAEAAGEDASLDASGDRLGDAVDVDDFDVGHFRAGFREVRRPKRRTDLRRSSRFRCARRHSGTQSGQSPPRLMVANELPNAADDGSLSRGRTRNCAAARSPCRGWPTSLSDITVRPERPMSLRVLAEMPSAACALTGHANQRGDQSSKELLCSSWCRLQREGEDGDGSSRPSIKLTRTTSNPRSSLRYGFRVTVSHGIQEKDLVNDPSTSKHP